MQLKLGNNKLTEFDFSAIGTTLTMLYLGLNSFTNFHSGLLQGLHNLQFLGLARLNVADWPNLTYFGSNKFDGTKTINLNYADVDTLSSKPIFTWCKIDVITMIDRKLSTIPTFHCPVHNETKIAHFKLSENYLSDFTSFDGLTDLGLAGSLESLELDNNLFTKFPNLSHSLRNCLLNLDLHGNNIEVIWERDLVGYNLQALNLGGNNLRSVPEQVFTTSAALVLQGWLHCLHNFNNIPGSLCLNHYTLEASMIKHLCICILVFSFRQSNKHNTKITDLKTTTHVVLGPSHLQLAGGVG